MRCARSGYNMAFRIVRYFSDGRPAKRVKVVSTLEIARLHCSSPGTSGELPGGVRWFDGFRETRRGKK